MRALSRFRSTIGVPLGVLLSHLTAATLVGQQPLPVSKGVYRLPYADGTSVRISQDHLTHSPTRNRLDMRGRGTGPFVVVAAAAGWIRIIVENNDTWCPDACQANNSATPPIPENDCDGNGTTSPADNNQAQNRACGTPGLSANCCERHFEANGGTCPGTGTSCLAASIPNNFVWIEHPNGEWSKYTHMQRGTIGPGPDNSGNAGAGRFVGEFVSAGTPLGLEGDVGIATNPHLHFEVAVFNFVERLADLQTLNTIEIDPDFPPDTVCHWFGCGTCPVPCPPPAQAPPAPLLCLLSGCVDGWLVGDGVVDDLTGNGNDNVNRQNRIPVFCQGGIASQGDIRTAGPCNDLCDDPVNDVSGLTIATGSVPFYTQVAGTIGNPSGNFVVQPFAGAALRAGLRVTLSPGFRAQEDSYFSASIGACDTPGGTGE